MVMTAGLWIRRATTEPEYGMLFTYYKDDGSIALVLKVPELNYRRQVSPDFEDMRAFWWLKENRSVPIIARKEGENTSSLYQFNPDAIEFETVARVWIGEYLTDVYLAPNQKWLSYPVDDTNHLEVCQLLNLETGQVLNLREKFADAASILCGEFSSDSNWAWLYLPSGSWESGNSQNAYRIRLSDGFVDNVNERFDGASIELGSLDGDWVIGRPYENGLYSNRYYWTDPTKVQWHPILEQSFSPISDEFYQEWVVDWLPDENLLIVEVLANENRYGGVVGVPAGGGSPIWTLDEMYYLYTPDCREWLFFKDQNDQLYRMRPDGTEFTLIGGFPLGYEGVISPNIITDQNGTKWFYAETYAHTNLVWRMHLDGTHREEIIQHSEDLTIANSSPDKQWLLLSSGISEGWYIYYRARLDGSNLQLLSSDSSLHFFDWSLSPTKSSQSALLLIIGIGLIGSSIFGKRPYHLMRQRRRPAA
ncbi:MAG: hypothetical protein K8L91_02000 [Anaerolineae bacterium]|nr:hypothetical protein [Anaerolineae bacterium]